MGFFKRLFGLCDTQEPQDPTCWSVSEGRIAIDLARAPELSAPGGALRLEGNRLGVRVLVVHGQDGAFHAFPNRCAHFGRRLDPLGQEARIRCSSLGMSTYDYAGHPLSGAAGRDIQPFKVEKEENRISILLNG